MSTFNILFGLFVVTFIVNLVHWHGKGRYFHRPETVAGRRLRIGVRVAVIALLVLFFTHILTADVGLDIVFALLVIQHLAMIWRRYHKKAHPPNPALKPATPAP